MTITARRLTAVALLVATLAPVTAQAMPLAIAKDMLRGDARIELVSAPHPAPAPQAILFSLITDASATVASFFGL